jgi:hypothetical protein
MPAAQAQTSISSTIKTSTAGVLGTAHSFGLAIGSSQAPLPAIALPNQFRRDPLAGMEALEHWSMALQGGHQNAAAVLRETLDLAHGSPQWSGKMASAFQNKEKTVPAALAVAWPADLPDELRDPVAALLDAIAQAETWRQLALARWPSEVSAADLWRRFGFSNDGSTGEESTSTQALLGSVDERALAYGMLQLTSAVEYTARALETSLQRRKRIKAGAWRFGTPWGEVLIDTTPDHTHYRGQQPLLLIDTSGNDSYTFDQDRPPGITVLLDFAGNDGYQGGGLGRDPSSATLGYAVLRDSSGDDRYEGHWLTQGAALFGAALLIDHHGRDRYQAQGQAQGFALGGIAMLLDFDGDDRYDALTQAQASAGPSALAVLFDRNGNDRYALANTPVVLPSAQLKNSNASLGQGTAFGLRSKGHDANPNSAGGLALLLDAQGHDTYEAQVFAQGAGYEGGLGVLWDGGGSDQMQAAWYAMGAAAHSASGVMVAVGTGHDVYTVSHATSLGAAHDASVAIFVGGPGNDNYRWSNLGVGAAHDGSTALFVERAGNDRYHDTHPLCRAFGASIYSPAHAERLESTAQEAKNIAVFMDQAGQDVYPPNCSAPGNGIRWSIGDAEKGLGVGQDHTTDDALMKHARASNKTRYKPR